MVVSEASESRGLILTDGVKTTFEISLHLFFESPVLLISLLGLACF